MRPLTLSLTFFLTILVSLDARSADDWVYALSTATQAVSIKKGSDRVETSKSGDQVVTIIAREEDLEDDSIEIRKYSVRMSDCERGYGKLQILDLDNSVVAEIQFAEGGGNLASGVADIVCFNHVELKREAAGATG